MARDDDEGLREDRRGALSLVRTITLSDVTGKVGVILAAESIGLGMAGIVQVGVGLGLVASGGVLAVWWFVVPYLWRRVPLPVAAPAGFRLLENQLFAEDKLHGVRIRLQPKGFTPETVLRYAYDAPLTVVRWRVAAHAGGRHRNFEMDWIEREAGNEAARAVEIAFNGPPAFTSHTDLVVELLGPAPVRVNKIDRIK
jgi:hypothetical protein